MNWDLIEHFRQDAIVSEECTIHTQFYTDRARGIRKKKVEKKWLRKKEIGRGSSGTVWLEVSGDNDRFEERAVKIISKSIIRQLEVDYKKELLALTKFSKQQHQQEEVLVTFFGWFEDAANLFLTMEYFGLGDLEHHISESMTENEIKDITTDILNGLRIMHSENFAHRDVKPGNIFVVQKPPNSRWWVKIGDFGISKRAQDGAILLTQTGTPGYQAPEVCGYLETDDPTSVYDKAVDIWSLGCVVYKISTQTLPFPKPGDILKFCNGRLQFPEQALLAKMDMDGVNFVKSLIERVPQERSSAESALKASWLVQRKSDVVVVKTKELTSCSTPKPKQTASDMDQDRTKLYTPVSKFEAVRPPPTKNTSDSSPFSQLEASASHSMLLRPGDSFVMQIIYLISHERSVNAVAFSPDSELLATASKDMTVQLWHSTTGVRRNILRGHQDEVTDVKFSPDGKFVASGSHDGTVILWFSATGAKYGSLTGDKEIFALAFMPNSSLIISACFDMTVELWRFPTGEKVNTLRGGTRSVDAVAFSSDSETLAFASDDMIVRLRNLRTGETCNMVNGHRDQITAIAFSPDCKLVASASHDMTVKLWELDKRLERKTIDIAAGPITALAFGPNGNMLVCGSRESTIRLYDTITGFQLYMMQGSKGRKITNVAFSPDGTMVASAFDDGFVRLLHLDVKAIYDTCRGHRVPPLTGDQSSCHSMIDSHSSVETHIALTIDPTAGLKPAASFGAKSSAAFNSADLLFEKEENYTIKCICGFQDDGSTVFCDLCETWQHIQCYYFHDGAIPDLAKFEHSCFDCKRRQNSLIRGKSRRRRS